MAASRIRDGVPVSAVKDCKGHCASLEGRDRESEVERSDTSTLYVLIDLDHPPK